MEQRPITAYATLDLPTYYVDLSPFIPLLSDGKPHNITLDVVSAEADHEINQNWYVTANLQVVLDSSEKATTGSMTVHSAPLYASTTTTGQTNGPGDIDFTLKASRNIHIESDIITGSGTKTYVVWSQSLSYENTQTYRQNASVQVCDASASALLTRRQGSFSILDFVPNSSGQRVLHAQRRPDCSRRLQFSLHQALSTNLHDLNVGIDLREEASVALRNLRQNGRIC